MGLFDTSGNRVNWGDRFTKNLVTLALVGCFVGLFYTPARTIDQGLIETLKNAIMLIIGYRANNNDRVQEKKDA
jgi:hypothetical protein